MENGFLRRILVVMVREDPPSMSLMRLIKGADSDFRRHKQGQPESRCQCRLVLSGIRDDFTYHQAERLCYYYRNDKGVPQA